LSIYFFERYGPWPLRQLRGLVCNNEIIILQLIIAATIQTITKKKKSMISLTITYNNNYYIRHYLTHIKLAYNNINDFECKYLLTCQNKITQKKTVRSLEKSVI